MCRFLEVGGVCLIWSRLAFPRAATTVLWPTPMLSLKGKARSIHSHLHPQPADNRQMLKCCCYVNVFLLLGLWSQSFVRKQSGNDLSSRGDCYSAPARCPCNLLSISLINATLSYSNVTNSFLYDYPESLQWKQAHRPGVVTSYLDLLFPLKSFRKSPGTCNNSCFFQLAKRASFKQWGLKISKENMTLGN